MKILKESNDGNYFCTLEIPFYIRFAVSDDISTDDIQEYISKNVKIDNIYVKDLRSENLSYSDDFHGNYEVEIPISIDDANKLFMYDTYFDTSEYTEFHLD